MVWVSHNAEQASRIAPQTMFMEGGRIVVLPSDSPILAGRKLEHPGLLSPKRDCEWRFHAGPIHPTLGGPTGDRHFADHHQRRDLALVAAGSGAAAGAGRRPHRRATALDRPGAQLDLPAGPGMVHRAGHDDGHDPDRRRRRRGPHRTPLPRHLARQRRLDVGDLLAGHRRRAVRRGAGPAGPRAVVSAAIRHSAVGHDPGEHPERHLAGTGPAGRRTGLEAGGGRDLAGPGQPPAGRPPGRPSNRPFAPA